MKFNHTYIYLPIVSVILVFLIMTGSDPYAKSNVVKPTDAPTPKGPSIKERLPFWDIKIRRIVVKYWNLTYVWNYYSPDSNQIIYIPCDAQCGISFHWEVKSISNSARPITMSDVGYWSGKLYMVKFGLPAVEKGGIVGLGTPGFSLEEFQQEGHIYEAPAEGKIYWTPTADDAGRNYHPFFWVDWGNQIQETDESNNQEKFFPVIRVESSAAPDFPKDPPIITSPQANALLEPLKHFYIRVKFPFEPDYPSQWRIHGVIEMWDSEEEEWVNSRNIFMDVKKLGPFYRCKQQFSFRTGKYRIRQVRAVHFTNASTNESAPVIFFVGSKLQSDSKIINHLTSTDQDFDFKKYPTMQIIMPKSTYQTNEMIRLRIAHAPGKPAFEFQQKDNRIWHNMPAPQVLGSKTTKATTGDMTEQALRFNKPGTYRLRCRIGNSPWGAWCNEIKVEKTIGKQVAGVRKEPGQVSPQIKRAPQEKKQTKHVQEKLGDTKKKTPGKLSAPVFQNLASGQKLAAGEPILLKIKPNTKYKKYKVKYELYKNACQGKPFKVSTSNNFGKLLAGRYCVRAAYVGGKKDNWSKGIPFVVEMKKKVKTIPEKKIVPRKKAVTQ